MRRHAGGRCMDQSIGSGDGRIRIGFSAGLSITEIRAEFGCQPLGALIFQIENAETSRAEMQERVGHCGPRPARAEQYHLSQWRAGQSLTEALRESGGVGVETDAFS